MCILNLTLGFVTVLRLYIVFIVQLSFTNTAFPTWTETMAILFRFVPVHHPRMLYCSNIYITLEWVADRHFAKTFKGQKNLFGIANNLIKAGNNGQVTFPDTIENSGTWPAYVLRLNESTGNSCCEVIFSHQRSCVCCLPLPWKRKK